MSTAAPGAEARQGAGSGLFAPTVWLSARLSFSRKYMVIGLLVMIALAALSTPLLLQINRQIETAARERVGLGHVAAQTDLLAGLVRRRSALLGNDRLPDPAALDRAVRQAVRIGRADGLEADAARLEQGWQASQGELGEPQVRFAAATGAINAALALIRDEARLYRLNVDPDLDAALEMLSLRLPLVLDIIGKQRDALAIRQADITSYALSAQVALTESAPVLRAGVGQLVAAGADPALGPQLSRLLADNARQQDSVDRSVGAAANREELQQIAQGNIASAQGLLAKAASAVDSRLRQRIEALSRERAVILALILGELGVVFYLFAGIYISTLQSLKRLSHGTRAFCSGRMDARIQIDTHDELVLIARNFNTMASEVERLLGVIQQQNESRQAELESEVRLRTAELAERNRELQRAGKRVAEELDLARSMQKAILPQTFPDEAGWGVHAAMHPARELGGDFYDCVPLPGGRYGVLVADVAGKGVGAAFFMAVARTVLLDLALSGLSPEAVLARANDLLCERNPVELFVTTCYAVFDPGDGSLVYASAGHHPPLVRRADGRAQTLASANEVALGVMPQMAYSLARAQLAPGEAVLLYTDGITEAFDAAGDPYGDARLAAWFERCAPDAPAADLVAGLVADVARFVGGEEASDDLTCLVLCRKSGELPMQDPPKPASVPALPVEIGDKRQLLHRLIDSRVEEIAGLAEAIEEALPDRADLAFVANLCLEELITNTILHGFAGQPGHAIEVFLNRSEEWLEIILKDDAPPFDPFVEAPAPDIEADLDGRAVGGLGVYIVKTMMDAAHAYYDGGGNLIVLLKALQQPESPTQ